MFGQIRGRARKVKFEIWQGHDGYGGRCDACRDERTEKEAMVEMPCVEDYEVTPQHYCVACLEKALAFALASSRAAGVALKPSAAEEKYNEKSSDAMEETK